MRRRLLSLSKELSARSDEDWDRDYVAWRWLGERSPSMGYLVACPQFALLRVGDDVHVAWDNAEIAIDGLQVWTAESGAVVLSVEDFVAECRSFADRLLASMESRIATIATGKAKPRIAVDVRALGEEREAWTQELERYFESYAPDIQWLEAESALREIAHEGGIRLSENG